MKKLIAGIVATAVIYGLFYLYASPTPPETDWRDEVWIGFVTATFTLAAIIMLMPRVPWTWRGVGLFLTSFATASLWGGVLYSRHDDDPSPRIPEEWVDLVRALYIVGGPLLLWGLLAWLGDQWREWRTTTESRDSLDRAGLGPAATVHPRRRMSDWSET